MDEDKSWVARQLINYGLVYIILKKYMNGTMSIGRCSKALGMNIFETINLLSEFGAKSPITYEEYLDGYKNIEDLF